MGVIALVLLQPWLFRRRAINVVAFAAGHGEIRVNNIAYSGTEGPQGTVPRGSIFWSADPQLQTPCKCSCLGFGGSGLRGLGFRLA